MQINDLFPAPGSRKNAQARRPRQRQRPRHAPPAAATRARTRAPAAPRAPASRAARRRCAMRLPKLPGFKNRNRVEYAVVNVSRLDELFADGDVVDGESLVAKGIVKSADRAGQGARRRRAHQEAHREGRTRSPAPPSRRSRQPEGRSRRRANSDLQRVPHSGAASQDPLHVGDDRPVPPRRVHPVPGVNLDTVKQLITDNATLGLLGLFSGGALEKFAVFSLGIMPYITRRSSCSCCRASSRRSSSGRRKARPGSARSPRSRGT